MRALKREPAPQRDLAIREVTPFPRRTDRLESLAREVRALLSQFTLRPHGDQLLSPTARFWIFCARVLILIMATAEAVSWGYVGSLFGSGFMSFVTALAAGFSLFFVIWLVDATFVTMDPSRAYYHKLLATEDQVSSEVEQRKVLRPGLRFRGVIGVVSLLDHGGRSSGQLGLPALCSSTRIGNRNRSANGSGPVHAWQKIQAAVGTLKSAL